MSNSKILVYLSNKSYMDIEQMGLSLGVLPNKIYMHELLGISKF